ncbi:MAG: hypothetical protein K0B15_07355 [Lentimicrobium sp.]|nr:hypothetical protein [Lentimicrobium sp.]
MPPVDPFDLKHIRNVEAYSKQINELYADAIGKIARIGGSVSMAPGAVFNYSKHPQFKAQFAAIFNDMADKLEAVVINGISKQWLLGDEKAIAQAMKALKGSISMKAFEKVSAKNFGSTSKAMESFLSRKNAGLGLSDRVWNYTNQFKGEMELALQLGIQSGQSSIDLAQSMQKYLREPDKLFRRVGDEFGQLHLSKAAKKYSPGNGVYRSSYKNAHRLVRTEINMAYRKAENERYKSLPFVVGYEVRLSNAHPAFDICDDLKGKYPKEFSFSGWHPQCLCHTVPVMASEDEYDTMEQQILSGQPITPIDSQNSVKEPPAGFVNWVDNNRERATGWKSQPYFIKDNFKGGTLKGKLSLA